MSEEQEDLSNVPRRLRRFYRKGQLPPESSEQNLQRAQAEMKKQSSLLAQREINRFKERFKRFPKNGEFDEIAENIYNQEKKQLLQEGKEMHGRFRHAKPGEISEKDIVDSKKQKPESKIPGEKKTTSLNVEDLLKQKPESEEPKLEKKEELELSDLNLETDDLQKSLDELSEEENSESFLKETESEKNTCPTCNTKTDHLVFCPECGAAFCTHCAKQTKSLGDKISYVCPKCNTEFKARKME